LRQDYEGFQARNAEIIAIGPDSPDKMRKHWIDEQIPYPGVPDPDKRVLETLGQEFKWLRFGRMPAIVIVNKNGEIAFTHYGDHAGDIPDNNEILAVIDRLDQ
jgi:peroxiredoxin